MVLDDASVQDGISSASPNHSTALRFQIHLPYSDTYISTLQFYSKPDVPLFICLGCIGCGHKKL